MNNQQQNKGTAGLSYKWKLQGKYKFEFPAHFTLVFISDEAGYYILGGNGNLNTCLHFDHKTIKPKAQMPQEKTFFAAVYC